MAAFSKEVFLPVRPSVCHTLYQRLNDSRERNALDTIR